MQSNQLTDFFADLRHAVGGDVRTDLYNRTLYSTDASLYQVLPLGVFFPRHADEVAAAVTLAAQYQIPVLPRAGGTALAGQTVNAALVIDTTHHMDRLLEVNAEERRVRVQPGLILDALNRQLKPTGLQFGPDPASSNRAAMGGIVGNNATGSHSILYGMAVDHVLETRVVLDDGTPVTFGPLDTMTDALASNGRMGKIYRGIYNLITTHGEVIRTGTPRHWRRCGGYNLFRFVDGVPDSPYPRADGGRFNLAQLICGSEGTLGMITELTLNLVPRPQLTALGIIHFDDAYTTMDATQAVLETQPSAVELLDRLSMQLCRTQPTYAKLLNTFIEGKPECVLITEYYGDTEAELQDKLDKLTAHLRQRGVKFTAMVPLLTPEQQSRVWQVRKAGLGLVLSKRGDYKPISFVEDSAVPVEHLADYITRLEAFCHSLGTEMAYYAHASGGCLHVRPLVNTKLAEEVAKLPEISRYAVSLLKEYGGTWSSEHGDGRSRSWLNESFFGPELYNLFRQVKHTFDPHGLFNPGNIVEAGPMTDNLRFDAAYHHIPLTEHLDFSSDMGLHRAVEMCNGAGVCRKVTAGTMCPSYMVTKEEEHSTRGRANLLRAAFTGKMPAEEFTSPRMYHAMDLCISCKACKTECPSSVDMAKIKFEFLAHYYENHGIPLRARLFGAIGTLSRLTSGPLAGLVNAINRWSPMRHALDRWMGISAKRTLPHFASEPFTAWFKRRDPVNLNKPKVVLFNDTFNTYNDPHIAIAATEVLEAAGFQVILPGHHCCGRPAMSKGLVNEARTAAASTVAALYPLAAQGLPIVGLEPSCLLSMRDEYHYLLPTDDRVATIAAQCLTFEEFMAQQAEAGTLDVPFEAAGKILLHGHCHQKALVGTQPSHQTLSRAGYTVEAVEAGCCGMAGAFGYETEHYDISIAMGERRLFPAVRKQADDTIIVAAGTSCREQIWDGTGRRAKHPAEVLREALANKI